VAVLSNIVNSTSSNFEIFLTPIKLAILPQYAWNFGTSVLKFQEVGAIFQVLWGFERPTLLLFIECVFIIFANLHINQTALQVFYSQITLGFCMKMNKMCTVCMTGSVLSLHRQQAVFTNYLRLCASTGPVLG